MKKSIKQYEDQIEKMVARPKADPTEEEQAIEMAIDEVGEGYDFDENYEELARGYGCSVVYPASNELQIDIDSKEALVYFEKRLREFKVLWRYNDIVAKRTDSESKSGGDHKHITLALFRRPYPEDLSQDTPHHVTESERIMLQFALGSDPIRETLSTMRVIFGHKCPTKIFVPIPLRGIEEIPNMTRKELSSQIDAYLYQIERKDLDDSLYDKYTKIMDALETAYKELRP